MIDEIKLLKNILYSDKWNNQPCPMWVIRMIVAWDAPVVNHTPEESCTHVMASDVINKDNTKLSMQDVIRYLCELVDFPCDYMIGTMDIGDVMKKRYPNWCNSTCTKHSNMECWQKYFEMRKEEEKWEK